MFGGVAGIPNEPCRGFGPPRGDPMFARASRCVGAKPHAPYVTSYQRWNGTVALAAPVAHSIRFTPVPPSRQGRSRASLPGRKLADIGFLRRWRLEAG